MEIFKRKDFARWQAAHRLSDEVLCKAVDEMCRGLVDASLGGELFKKRVAAHGAGKRGGYRTLLSARIGNRCVFLHGFAKSDKANITLEEQSAAIRWQSLSGFITASALPGVAGGCADGGML